MGLIFSLGTWQKGIKTFGARPRVRRSRLLPLASAAPGQCEVANWLTWPSVLRMQRLLGRQLRVVPAELIRCGETSIHEEASAKTGASSHAVLDPRPDCRSGAMPSLRNSARTSFLARASPFALNCLRRACPWAGNSIRNDGSPCGAHLVPERDSDAAGDQTTLEKAFADAHRSYPLTLPNYILRRLRFSH
jgi:hypothetical protein